MLSPLSIDTIRLTYPGSPTMPPLQVLDGISLTVEPGTFVSIVGLNGSGKTSLLRVIAGLEKKFSGTVRLNDRPIRPVNGNIGFVTQKSGLLPWRTVLKNVMLGLEIRNVPVAQASEQARKYLESFGLADWANAYPHELSGGMRQKVAIARALITSPELVLMDEPFSALDCQNRNAMQSFLLRIWQQRRDTVIFVTHNIEEAVYMSDTIVVISTKPTKIMETVPVCLERPRERTDPEFNQVRRYVIDLLRGQ